MITAEPGWGLRRPTAMERHLRRALLPAALLLCLTACGADAPSDASTGTVPTGSVEGAGGVAGACLEGAADCADMPTGTGGPESGPDGSLPVADAVTAGVDGPFLMSGFYLADGSGTRLCEALAESFPPQCGGASIVLDETGTAVETETVTEGDVTWSEQSTSVEGQIVDDVFVVGSP